MLTEAADPKSDAGSLAWAGGQAPLLAQQHSGSFPTPQEIERLQLGKLRSLLAAIRSANPFYARKLALCAPGFAPDSLEAYSRLIPITTRHELVRDRLAHPPYGTNLTFPPETYVRCHQTSGTTTVPMRWLDTAESWSRIV